MMIDLALFIGRIVLVVLLYAFLFAVMKTGHVDILGPVVIGRSPSSDIVINEPFVSATHARFTLQGPALVLEDLGSKNGTLVNGHPIGDTPVTLRDGDEVQVGDAIMHVSRR